MANDLAKLNRLRENAGKTALKSWKASQEKLDEAISKLESEGFTDVVTGADTSVAPQSDDPEVSKALEEKPEPKVTKGKAQLGKGLENEPMARQSRIALAMERDREKREKKAEKAEAKAKAKEEKKPKLGKGEVDPKKDPEKAARQKKHIEEKKKARESKPKKEKNSDEISVADIARELDIDPKVARAKLRRHEDKIKKLHTKGQDRWTFPIKAKDKIVEILS